MKRIALITATASAVAMIYIGLYQSRAVEHLWCPIFNKGCEAVADAPSRGPLESQMATLQPRCTPPLS